MRELPELHTGPAKPLPKRVLSDKRARVVPTVFEELANPPKSTGVWEWKIEFADITDDSRELTEHYYASECRPLRELKIIHGYARRIHKLDFREWLELRDRARKDLYWLGKDCIATETSGAGFVEHVHRQMCGMFVPKNFNGVYHKNFTLRDVRDGIGRQDREKEMLMLAPRGSFKSTVNKIDCVQWMLNCPDVRILILTGEFKLAEKFLKEVKGFFYKPDEEKHTFFQSLFPEYVLDNDPESGAPIFCPARLIRQAGQPTLWVNSIGGAVAGWHCDVSKGDDVVNEDNSNNEDTREKLKDRYDNVSENLPDEWAFKDHIGTRYYPDDYYGGQISAMKQFADTNSILFLSRSAWKVKPGFEAVPIKQLQEHMVDLYFPEKLDFISLIRKCRKNEKEFRCQQLNEPAGGDVAIHFDEDALKAHVIIANRVPRPAIGERRVVCVWDTAHSENTQSDYSAGVAGYCHEDTRALYVLEVLADKWKDSQLAVQIVDMHFRWKPLFSEIEKFAGWELLAAEIQRVAWRKYGRTITLAWRDVENSSNAKRNRVKGLESLLTDDRLWFVEGEWLDLAFQQFMKFTGFSKRRKDDIPDAISFLQRLIPVERHMEDATAESEAQRKAREAEDLRQKFAAQHAEKAPTMLFTYTPPAIPEPQPDIDATLPEKSGPERMFGSTGIHL